MIGYYLHHQGEGHRRRGVAVAGLLRHDVTGLGSGPPPEGWTGAWVPLERDDDPPVPDPVAADTTARGTLHWVPRHHPGLLVRHRRLVDWVAEARPALLVVDVSVEVCLVARLCGVPVVVAAMPGDRLDRPHRLAYDLAEALLAPWPPDAHPDAGWPPQWRDKVWEVGGISALAAGDGRAPSSGAPSPVPPVPAGEGGTRRTRRVLVLWGRGGEDVHHGDVEAARAATPGWEWTVRGGGAPVSADLREDLDAADVVVCHAGQNAVADVALARRPAVVLAQPRPHREQEATVRALERLSLAATATGWPSADRWPDLLGRALELGGEGWSVWGGDGAGRAAALLDDLADRLAPTAAAELSGDLAEGLPVAVLTLAHGRHDHLRGQIAGLAAGRRRPDLHVVVAMDDPQVRAVAEDAWGSTGAGVSTEVVVVDLPADPLGLPLARARNVAAATARDRGAHHLVLLDVDCIPGPGAVATYARELASRQTREAPHPAVLCGDVAYLPPVPDGQAGWVDMDTADLARLPEVGRHRPDRVLLPAGRRLPEPDLRQFWSLSFALTAEDFDLAGGFCEDYVGYGGEDTDFAQVVGARGGSLTWVGGATVYHQHHDSQSPPVDHLEAVVRNATVFADRWGWWPMEGWLAAFEELGLAAPDDAGRWQVLS